MLVLFEFLAFRVNFYIDGMASMRDTDVEKCRLRFQVVVNSEAQYSIWPDKTPLPNGWKSVGFSGTKGDCLLYISEIWTDMRPNSLKQMREEEGK